MRTINFKYLDIVPGNKILDIGCGEGRHTAEVCHFNDVFCVGADMNYKDLLTAKEKLKFNERFFPAATSNQALCAADITRLPFKDKSFDIVICSEVMEHIPEEHEAFAELTRVIKHKGILAVSVPRTWPEKICWFLSDEYFNATGGHIRIYTKKELIQKIEKTGYRLFKTHYAHSLHSPFWWLKCLAGPNRTDSPAVNLYHRLLVWDIMKKPFITKFMGKLLDPVMGKSLVLYFVRIPSTGQAAAKKIHFQPE